jgi:predicted alpha/beta-fold hydrolase
MYLLKVYERCVSINESESQFDRKKKRFWAVGVSVGAGMARRWLLYMKKRRVSPTKDEVMIEVRSFVTIPTKNRFDGREMMRVVV